LGRKWAGERAIQHYGKKKVPRKGDRFPNQPRVAPMPKGKFLRGRKIRRNKRKKKKRRKRQEVDRQHKEGE